VTRFTILNAFDSNPKGATLVTGFVNRNVMDPNKSSGEIAPQFVFGRALASRPVRCAAKTISAGLPKVIFIKPSAGATKLSCRDAFLIAWRPNGSNRHADPAA
jgi:hypothetical protein